MGVESIILVGSQARAYKPFLEEIFSSTEFKIEIDVSNPTAAFGVTFF